MNRASTTSENLVSFCWPEPINGSLLLNSYWVDFWGTTCSSSGSSGAARAYPLCHIIRSLRRYARRPVWYARWPFQKQAKQIWCDWFTHMEQSTMVVGGWRAGDGFQTGQFRPPSLPNWLSGQIAFSQGWWPAHRHSKLPTSRPPTVGPKRSRCPPWTNGVGACASASRRPKVKQPLTSKQMNITNDIQKIAFQVIKIIRLYLRYSTFCFLEPRKTILQPQPELAVRFNRGQRGKQGQPGSPSHPTGALFLWGASGVVESSVPGVWDPCGAIRRPLSDSSSSEE